jgi:lipopolysaccharide transport system ATP-binding protein
LSGLALRARNLGKSYRRYPREWKRFASWLGFRPGNVHDHWAVKDVGFDVRRGESLGILGRNGAGKSTLLKLIAGVLQPTIGSVEVNGRVSAILELGAGFNPELTCRDNVALAASLAGVPGAESAARMPTIEAFADIGEYFDRPLRECSSGMSMRVAFAVATAFEPEILIVDEAMAVGDASFQAKCFERIAQFRARGCTLLFVSHAVEAVAKHCDRAIFMNAGRVVMDGHSRAVGNAYLEHLFATARGGNEPQRDGAAIEAASIDDSPERYHLRPGYRKDEHRWGSRTAAVLDFHIEANGRAFPGSIQSGSVVRVVVKVLFQSAIDRPVFGLLIKSLDGVFLYGTNSKLASEIEIAPASAGDIRAGEFRFSCALNSGTYLLSLGISAADSDGAMTPLDRRYDSILLEVTHPKPFWGIADMSASFAERRTPR